MALAPNTSLISVDNASGANITPVTDCLEIRLQEDGQAGTTDFYIQQPSGTGTFVKHPAGKEVWLHPIKGTRFFAGVTIGKIKTVFGTVNFSQVEQ